MKADNTKKFIERHSDVAGVLSAGIIDRALRSATPAELRAVTTAGQGITLVLNKTTELKEDVRKRLQVAVDRASLLAPVLGIEEPSADFSDLADELEALNNTEELA